MVSATRPHRGRFIKNYTVLDLDGEPEKVKERWLESIRDLRAWCFNSTNSRYEFGSVSHRCAMIPERDHFFWYLHHQGKWMCPVIAGSTLYLVGFILTSVGNKKDWKVQEMMDSGAVKKYIEGAEKMTGWFGNYRIPQLIQVGIWALRSAFVGMLRYLSGELPRPSVLELRTWCDVFVIHLPEAGRYDSLALCSIYTRFVEGGRVGVRQKEKIQSWSADCRDALEHVTVIETTEEKNLAQKVKYGRKEKVAGRNRVSVREEQKSGNKMTKEELESALADIRLFHRPFPDHQTASLSSMPVQLRNGDLVGDFPSAVDQSDMNFLIQPVHNVPHVGCQYVNKQWFCRGPGFIDTPVNNIGPEVCPETKTDPSCMLTAPIPQLGYLSLTPGVQEKGHGAGLLNLGNTCYANTVLQCLSLVPEFVSGLKSYSDHMKRTAVDDNHHKLTLATFNTLHEMKQSVKPVRPSEFLESLRNVHPNFAEIEDDMKRPQDAEELWSQLLRAIDGAFVSYSRESSGIIKDLFGIYLRVHRKGSDEPEDDSELSYTMQCNISGNVQNLNEGIQNSLQSKFLEIDRLPRYLAVHIERSQWNDHLKKPEKNTKQVKYPVVLDIYGHCSDSLQAKLDATQGTPAESSSMQTDEANKELTGQYELFCVLEHNDLFFVDGHYVAWTKQDSGNWLLYNDEVVRSCQESEALNFAVEGRTAYMCFYRGQIVYNKGKID